mgnify:CR=1 FL=1
MGVKEVKAKVEVPEISSLPQRMRRTMNDLLSGVEDTHEYKLGLAHPMESVLDHISRANRFFYNDREYRETASKFLRSVSEYVKAKSKDATWDGKPEKIILLSDWQKIF